MCIVTDIVICAIRKIPGIDGVEEEKRKRRPEDRVREGEIHPRDPATAHRDPAFFTSPLTDIGTGRARRARTAEKAGEKCRPTSGEWGIVIITAQANPASPLWVRTTQSWHLYSLDGQDGSAVA